MLLGLMVVGGLLLLVAALSLAYLNRSSEALRSNATTATVVGVAGLLATLWFSLRAPDPQAHRFPVTFVVEKETRLPLSREGYPSVWQYATPDALRPVFVDVEPFVKLLPEKEADRSTSVETAYLDVMVAYVMDVLIRCFGSSWDVDIVIDRTLSGTVTRTSPRKPIPTSLKVRRDALMSHLSAKRLLAVAMPGWEEFVVPPDTKIDWVEDQRTRLLKMSNPFVTVSVAIERGFMTQAGSGGLAELEGIPTEESRERHMVLSFAMQLDATFERLRSGHPDMPRYVKWVDTFFSRLREFDAEPSMAGMEQVNVVVRGLKAWHQRERRPGGVGSSPPPD